MFDIQDLEILPLSMEHNFWTWSAQGKVAPIPVKSAKGVYFWDVDGKRYLDFNSMTMCVNIGHGDQRVIDAIVDQARELPYAGPPMTTKPRAILRQAAGRDHPRGTWITFCSPWAAPMPMKTPSSWRAPIPASIKS